MMVVSSGFRGWKNTLNFWKLLAECFFKLENVVGMYAYNCYDMVRLFVEALLLDSLEEHWNYDCFEQWISVWRDWVMINWGEHGVLPNCIWGFFDLRKLPNNNL
jgi:hypothetical protein